MINLNKITEATLVVKSKSMNQTHLTSSVVVSDVILLVLFMLRQILCDKKQHH